MQPLISIRDLHKTYPNGTAALKGVTLDVMPGEFLVVIGLSGSGKSTLLRCLNRLVDPTQGEIKFRGERVDHVRGQEVLNLRKRLAMIFQHFNLIQRFTALDNVLMGRLSTTSTWKSLFKRFSPSDRAEAERCLKLVGLAEKTHSRVDQLSGGQQQRVAIARALCQDPEVILADEPVASLDPATCFTVMNSLRKANREIGLTVVCNLHFLSLAREYATRVVALRDGTIVFNGSPQEITPQKFKEIYGEDAKEVYVE